MSTQAKLDSIRVLYREADTLALWGIPYKMRPEQSPRHLKQAQRDWKAPKPGWHGSNQIDLSDWIWLGNPGWDYDIPEPERVRIKAFLAKHKDLIPGNPHEWVELPEAKSFDLDAVFAWADTQ